MKFLFVVIFVFMTISFTIALPSSSFTHRDTLINFVKSSSIESVQDAFYAIESLKGFLNSELDNKKQLCNLATQTLSEETAPLREIFYAVTVAEKLGCGSKVSDSVASQLVGVMKASSSTTEELFFATSSAFILRENNHLKFNPKDYLHIINYFSDLSSLDGTIKNSRKSNRGNLFFTGLAFRVMSYFTSTDSLDDEREDLIETFRSTAEEILSYSTSIDNGRVFMDRGDSKTSLRVSSTLLSGVVALSDESLIQHESFDGVAEYVLSLPPPESLRELFYYTSLLSSLTSKKVVTPVAVELLQNSVFAGVKGEGNIRVRITDILGNPVSAKVYLLQASSYYDDKQILLSNQALSPVKGSDTDYEFNFFIAKPDKGFYSLEFGVQLNNQPLRSTTRIVKVLSSISVDKVSLEVIDVSDKEVDQRLTATQQKNFGTFSTSYFFLLEFTFVVKNKISNKPTFVQQAFIQLSANGLESTLPAKFNGDKYVLSINMKDAGLDLLYKSGDYSIRLIIGDSFIDNSFVWELGTVSLTFPPSIQLPPSENVYATKPEIKHIFRTPDPRPSESVSFAFTCLTLSPWIILLVGLLSTGFSISFPTGIAFIHTSILWVLIVLIFGLNVVFWIGLNMFDTLKYLGVLSVAAVFFGNRSLRYRASKRKKETKSE